MKKILTVCSIAVSCSVFADDITFINSDKVDYTKDTITCSGNVVVVYCSKVITADRITYNRQNKTINAIGSVVIKDEKNTVYFADEFFVTRGFKSGKAKNIKIIMDDRSRLAATNGVIKDGKYYLNNVVYSPCYECGLGGEITWKIKAKQVICDPDDEIQYKNVKFELYGVTIANSPYFMHESPRVKRKSGFLPPKIATSSSNGFSFIAPYLWAMSNSQEIIFKPIITTKAGVIAWGEYNLLFPHGELSIDTSITNTSSLNGVHSNDAPTQEQIDKIKRNNYRGHFFAKLNYEINDIWRFGANINLVSDVFYFKRFSLLPQHERTLESNLRLEGFDGDNYTLIKCAKFQTENYEYIPRVFPSFERNYYADLFSGTLGIDISGMNLDFSESRSAQKLTANISWKKELLLYYGQLLNINAVLATRALRVDEKQHSQYNSEIGITPQISCIWSWPLVASVQDFKNVFSPIVGVILGNNRKFLDIFEYPFSELNTLNLFAGNRSISAYDIDSGSRVCYGVRTSGYYNGRNVYQCIIGQSTELTRPLKYADDSGLNHKCSNALFGLDVFLDKNLTLISRGSYNHHSKHWSQIEVGIDYQYKKFDFSTMIFNGHHCFYNPFDNNIYKNSEWVKTRKYKGVSFDCGYQITPKVKMFAGFTIGNKEQTNLNIHKDGECKLLKHKVGMLYKNECTELLGEVIVTKHHSGDLKPETSFRLTIHLKNLGI